ncbi:hypothetical protein [Torque teno midi virus 11]|nr:hypothetical protein [Torque teno midi virus 11]BAF76112.1 hypothetical protein [Torque teno midi virus 11]
MSNYSANHFFKPTPYNNDTKNQMWMSMISDGHDCMCNCPSPFGHLLASIFPPGHQDRFLTVEEIINRDIKECLFGGPDARDGGEAAAGPSTGVDTTIKREDPEEDFTKENIEELIAAAEKASER